VEVDFVGLWGFIVDHCVNAFDIETPRSEIGGEEE
jgi:hypothetical protein